MGAELVAAEQRGVNPPVVPTGSGLAKAGPFRAVGCAWSQPSRGCIIKLRAEGFYDVSMCNLKGGQGPGVKPFIANPSRFRGCLEWIWLMLLRPVPGASQ